MGVVAWPGDPKRGNTFVCCFCKSERAWCEGVVAATDADGQRFACKHHLSADRLFVAVFADYLVQTYEPEWSLALNDFVEGSYGQNLH